MEFKEYQRTTPTRARKLIEQDYISFNGMIETLEGPQPFLAGDYLGQDAKGAWPIKRATIEQYYLQVAPEDSTGFALFMQTGTRLAAQMREPFTIRGMQGKADDYLVLGGEGGWLVDRELFEQTYTLVEQKDQEI